MTYWLEKHPLMDAYRLIMNGIQVGLLHGKSLLESKDLWFQSLEIR